VKLGIEAKTSARLIPLWASSSIERLKLLENYGLSGYFDPAQNHAGRLLLLLALGAEMDECERQVQLLCAVAGRHVKGWRGCGLRACALVSCGHGGAWVNHGFLQRIALARERQCAARCGRSDRLRVRRLSSI
jgi:hypothetical protein